MSNKNKLRQPKKQFNPNATSFASIVWKVLVIILITAMLLSTIVGTIVYLFSTPTATSTDQIPQNILDQLKQQNVQITVAPTQ